MDGAVAFHGTARRGCAGSCTRDNARPCTMMMVHPEIKYERLSHRACPECVSGCAWRSVWRCWMTRTRFAAAEMRKLRRCRLCSLLLIECVVGKAYGT
eukprot:320213-Rhodomonas_salina.1